MDWLWLAFVYLFGAVLAAIVGCYESPPQDRIRDPMKIGMQSLLWPVLLAGLSVGFFALFLALVVVDRIIEWLGPGGEE